MLEEIAEPSEEKQDDDVERWEGEGGSCTKQNDEIKKQHKEEYQEKKN
ncbi:hypothetical protein HY485_02790 [Candidatus Woesearchaeota archaeon]|nr:hypothetical protein [Candidatus Woesearchaeota archaeon]